MAGETSLLLDKKMSDDSQQGRGEEGQHETLDVSWWERGQPKKPLKDSQDNHAQVTASPLAPTKSMLPVLSASQGHGEL